MALFRRKSGKLSSASSTSWPRGWQIQKVIVLLNWFTNPTIVQIQRGHKYFLLANSDGQNWIEKEIESFSEANRLMESIREDWKNAISIGLFQQNTDLYVSNVKTFGFTEFDSTVYEEKFTPDFTFTIGRELENMLLNDWFPETDNDLHYIFNYFYVAPIGVGFFGPYKFILKNLTNRFNEYTSSRTVTYMSHVAACIGFGYGKLEGYVGRSRNAPISSYQWQINQIHSLPELNGFRYPNLKTIQYLMRKSLRFLFQIERDLDPLIATRFKVHALWGADHAHDTRQSNEDQFLTLQQLTSYILYSDAKLANRDRESRKVELGSRKKRHHVRIPEEKIQSLSASEIAVYKGWIEDLDANSSPIIHYALSIARAFPEITFPWNEKVIKMLFSSESDDVRKIIWEAISKDPRLLRSIPSQALIEFIDIASDAQMEIIRQEMRSSMWAYQRVISGWCEAHVNSKLSAKDIKLAEFFLKIAWNIIPNITWTEAIPVRDNLFILVAKVTALQPLEEWKKIVSIQSWDINALLGFLGVTPYEKYPQGLIDVLDFTNREILDFFSKALAENLMWSANDRVNTIFDALLKSEKKGANEIVWTILGQNLLDQYQIDSLLDHLNKSDPAGNYLLKAIASSTNLNDSHALLGYLKSLREEAKEAFWRRNGDEVEKILRSWKLFPNFFWEFADRIPLQVLERIRKFEGIEKELLKAITPGYIARFNPSQIQELAHLLKQNPQVFSNPSLLKSTLIAASATLNEFGVNYVKKKELFSKYWLMMLESNLPIAQNAATEYLESLIDSKTFTKLILMALDSNNQGARRSAILVLGKVKSPKVIREIMQSLVENRNSDIWKVVTKHLEAIDNPEKYKEFTNQVFLSRRKGRQTKEDIKIKLEDLIEDIAEAVEADTLVRMAHSSVSKDRDWALKQIALARVNIDGVIVEESWRGKLDV